MISECEPWLASLLQTSDSLFPSGSYAHSLGLEGMVQSGLVTDHESLGRYLVQTVEPLLEGVELPCARLAQGAAQAWNVEEIVALASFYGAMKGSAELRSASQRLGAQRLRLLPELFPHLLWTQLPAAWPNGPFQTHATIVAGVQAAILRVPWRAASMALYYATISTTISAGMKLIRFGQVAAQRLLAQSLQRAAPIMERSNRLAQEEIGCFQPWLDIASARHEVAYSRIFIS